MGGLFLGASQHRDRAIMPGFFFWKKDPYLYQGEYVYTPDIARLLWSICGAYRGYKNQDSKGLSSMLPYWHSYISSRQRRLQHHAQQESVTRATASRKARRRSLSHTPPREAVGTTEATPWGAGRWKARFLPRKKQIFFRRFVTQAGIFREWRRKGTI